MKFRLVSAAVAALAAFGASAAEVTYSGSMLFGYCTTAQYSNTFGAGAVGGESMQFDEDAINYFRGCRITAIAVANGSPAVEGQTSWPVNLFVTEDLSNATENSWAAEMDLTKPFEYKEYPLAEPIEITAETEPFYVGISFTCDPAKVYPIVTDGTNDQSAGPGDWFGVQGADGSWTWEQLRSQVGLAAVRVKIEGDHLPANNVSVMASSLPTYAAPGGTAEVGMYLRNDAGNTVSSVSVEYSINGGETQTADVALPRPLLYNDYTLNPVYFTVTIPEAEGDNLPVSINVAAVNADKAANNAAEKARTASGTYLCLAADKGFDKAMVAEIATGTWCGYCPQGFVAVEKMQEKYPDGRFIPICAHLNDAMTATSYSQLTTDFGCDSAPSCVVNRNMASYGVQTPSFRFFDDAYQEIIATPALAMPSVDNATYDEKTKRLTVDASVEFAIPVTGNYAFSYVLVEDNVGPYDQTNYYSPAYNSGLTLEWWDEQGPQVSLLFNSVARYIYSFRGINGSIPESVNPGGKYSHSGTLQANRVKNINNCRIVLMVVNRLSGRIENAISVPYSQFSAINSVEAEVTDTPAVYFDLQGRPVAAPEHGRIYIERRGDVSRKIRY